MKQLRPYQISGVERLLEITKERHSALLADEPGLGKTIQVAEFINRTKPWSVLIVCPASLRINWKKELDAWLTHIPEELVIVNMTDTLILEAVVYSSILAVFGILYLFVRKDNRK